MGGELLATSDTQQQLCFSFEIARNNVRCLLWRCAVFQFCQLVQFLEYGYIQVDVLPFLHSVIIAQIYTKSIYPSTISVVYTVDGYDEIEYNTVILNEMRQGKREMEQLMEQIAHSKGKRTETLKSLRSAIAELGERYAGDALDQEILEHVTGSLYTEFGFASWWLRKRAHWDNFLAEARRQEALWETQNFDAQQCAFWDTLTNDVLNYLDGVRN